MSLSVPQEFIQEAGALSVVNESATPIAAEAVQTTEVTPVVQTTPAADVTPVVTPAVTDTTPVPADSTVLAPIVNPDAATGGIETPVQPTFEQILSERTGGSVKDIGETVRELEELRQLRTQYEAAPKADFADENIRLINAFVQQGKGTVNEAIGLITTDFTQMGELDVLRTQLAVKEPYLTAEQREAVISQIEDGLDADLVDAKTLQANQIDLLRKANAARHELTSARDAQLDELRLSIPALPASKTNEPVDVQALQTAWNQKVDGEILPLVTELSFSGDGLDFKIPVSEDIIASAKGDLYNIDNFSQRYVSADGKADLQRAAKDMFILNNLDKIIAEAVKVGKSSGTGNLLKEIHNAPTPTPLSAPIANAQPQSGEWLSAAASKMLGRR